MIKSFKHKGLEKFFLENSLRGIQAEHARRLAIILSALHAAARVANMDIHGWHLHPLQPMSSNLWSVRVNGNWRVTFRFVGSDAEVVDYLDYH